MKVEQPTGYIFQDRAFQGEGEVWDVFKEVAEACLQSLHDQERESSPWEEAETKELCDVGVAETGHQLALLQVLAHHFSHTFILHIYESLMELLSSTDEKLICYLEYESKSWS